MNHNEYFGEWLRKEIEERGWTMGALARRADVSHAAISRVVNGERGAGPELCRAIARAFEMPEEHVFRMAGLLSQLPSPDDDLTFAQVYDMMNRLTPEERREIMEYVEWRYKKSKQQAS